ncbi:MAG: 50S ribosomal protein L32 [Planctomycetaceae bacterium]|nr:50S ribosomal protein L32 [Planctomycetaceae bacterium]MCA9032055.1 50S ribosomal protein L32 [Planctomycetaceae bacterium]MCB9950318.1 50S ribosomal protein L32 [Planctomycetaceae bacterium]
MAVPKRRQSRSRSRKRRAHDGVKPMKLQNCSQCGTAVPSHVVCPNCGNYHGRTMVAAEE